MLDATERETCPHCGGLAIVGTTCPKSIDCPRCLAPAGRSCRRPSGHRASETHASRIQVAETLDHVRGIAYVSGELI